MACNARLDLARVHGRAADLEHVVAAAGEEEVPVVVEVADVAGRVEAVVGEHLGARASADAAHQVGAAQLDLAGRTRRRPARRCRGRRSRTSTSSNGRPQLPSLPGGSVWSRRYAAVGTERLGHAEQVRPRARARACSAGGQHRVEAARAQRRRGRRPRSRGSRASAAAWSGQPRNSVTRSRSRNGSVRAGSGRASVSSVAPATSVGEQAGAEPADPEERHRDVEAVVAVRRRTSSPAAVAPSAPPWVWITPLGVAAAAGGEDDGEVVGGPDRRVAARRPARARSPSPAAGPVAVPHGDRPQPRQRLDHQAACPATSSGEIAMRSAT